MQVIKKQIINDELSERINSVCKRLQNSVSQIQVINWLTNFQEEEWDLGLIVLENLRYFTISDIIYEFDESLKKILTETPQNQTLFLHGLGEFGKSGSSLIYYIKQTPTYKANAERLKILSHIKKIFQQGLREDSFLVLIDDIIGSGNSVKDFFNHNIKQQIVKERIQINTLILSIAYMENSLELLSKNIPKLKIYGTKYKKAFASGSSVFGYRPKMLLIREFCYKYGIELLKLYDRDLNEIVAHPLGFRKSQSLIVFAHSVPNNTLPIIWSSENGWYPLFPRRGRDKVSQNKDFRNETRLWLSYAYKFNIFQNGKPLSNIYFNVSIRPSTSFLSCCG